MNIETATKEELTKELTAALKALRGLIETEAMPACAERSSALWLLHRHKDLLPDDHRWTISASRGRTWEQLSY